MGKSNIIYTERRVFVDCDKASDLMMKYMDGVLTDAEAVSLNRHIKICSQCEEDFLMYDSIMNNFSEGTLSEPTEGFEGRVMALIMQLPETEVKSVNRPLFGVLGVFSVLLSLGIILDMNKESLLNWMRQYPQLDPLFRVFDPVSGAVSGISLQVSDAFARISSYFQQIGSGLNYVPLMLFGVLAAAQIIIYSRERVAGK